MNTVRPIADFSRGAMLGAIVATLAGGALIYALNMAGIAVIAVPEFPLITELLNQAWLNLRLSLLFFALALLAFMVVLVRLKRRLQSQRARLADIVRGEQLAGLCIALFFGIGVIWTAIGMRSALLYALGDPAAAAQAGAFAILQRMVDGGILLALTTTIVGGVGGYLMRLFKTLYLGGDLQAFYERWSQAERDSVLYTLRGIERHLQTLVDRGSDDGDQGRQRVLFSMQKKTDH